VDTNVELGRQLTVEERLMGRDGMSGDDGFSTGERVRLRAVAEGVGVREELPPWCSRTVGGVLTMLPRCATGVPARIGVLKRLACDDAYEKPLMVEKFCELATVDVRKDPDSECSAAVTKRGMRGDAAPADGDCDVRRGVVARMSRGDGGATADGDDALER